MNKISNILLISFFILFSSIPVYWAVVWSTNTGLDKIVDIINNDEWLKNRVYKKENIQKNQTWKITQSDIDVWARDSDEMNKIIIKSIKAIGIANDWEISSSDIRDLNEYINKNYLKTWIRLHWNDEKTYESWFHRVQGDWWNTILFWENAINTIADSIYHLGFKSKRNRVLNEDKNNNATFSSLSYRLNDLLADDIKSWKLNWPEVISMVWVTKTWLDKVVDIIKNDKALEQKVSRTDLLVAIYSSNEMNKIIIKAIKATWVANNWIINTADVRELNNYINKYYLKQWIKLHWNDEKTYETWYHRVQNDWAVSQIYGQNALNTVFDAIYHLWFKPKKWNRILNEDKNRNQKFSSIWFRLNDLLKNELKNDSLRNNLFNNINGTTNTWLDKIIDIIKNDKGLNDRIKISDIMVWAKSANEMNKILVEAIQMTGAANDNFISVDDVRAMHIYIVKKYRNQWIKLHWKKQDNSITWFHLIQSKGASKKILKRNAIDQIFEWIYNIGFSTDNDNRTKNEEWKYSIWFNSISEWLNYLMIDYMNKNKSLSNKTFNWLTVQSGNWANIESWYKWSDIARVWISLLDTKRKKGNTVISLKMNFKPDWKNENGSIVFDYKWPKNYKIIWARADWNYWEIGEMVNWKYKKISVAKEKISVNQDYKIDVVFKENFIYLYVNNSLKMKSIIHMSSQKIWFSVNRSTAEFKNIVVQNF